MTFDMQLLFLQEDERRNGQEEMVGYEFEPVSTQKSTWQAYKALLKVNWILTIFSTFSMKWFQYW